MQLRIFISDHLNNNKIQNYTENISISINQDATTKRTETKKFSKDDSFFAFKFLIT